MPLRGLVWHARSPGSIFYSFWVIKAAVSRAPDLAKLAALNKTDQFIPLGMRQPDDVFFLSDCDAFIRNLDLRAHSAGWA